jgi:hypothetical protein
MILFPMPAFPVARITVHATTLSLLVEMGVFQLFLPGLALNLSPSDCHLLNSWDYRHELPYWAILLYSTSTLQLGLDLLSVSLGSEGSITKKQIKNPRLTCYLS